MLKWNELLRLLGIGVGKNRNCIEKHEVKTPSKEIIEEKHPDSPRVKSDILFVKSLEAMTLNDSKEYSRKKIHDDDIFTSDDESFPVIDKYCKLGDLIDSISFEAKSNVDSCVQCDLSNDEQEDESSNILVNDSVVVNESDANETNSSCSEFLDATMSPPVEIHSSQQLPEEVYDKSLYHNETVYQDCNEAVEDDKTEGHTMDDDGPDEINSLKENKSTDKSISIETSTKKSEDETLEENGFGGSVCVNLTKSFIGEERDDDDQEFDNMDDSEIHIDQENESTGDESSVSGKKNESTGDESSV